jgi:lysophospholipase L1-like esterase
MAKTKDRNKKPLPLYRKLLFTLITLLLLLTVAFISGEILTRILVPWKETPPLPPPYNTAQKDDYLGWRMTPNYAFDGKMKDKGGQEYEVSIRYDANGFKAFGDTLSEKPKVFFIGDSYTACIEVSNGKSFFNLLKDSLGFEVFAYGHAGFGTLQEYMVFDKWVGRIKPDVVVWEVCSNDFIDNYAPLEIECGYKVGERRPYLQPNGSTGYGLAVSTFQHLRKISRFLDWLSGRSEKLYLALSGQEKRVGEYWISNKKREYPPFDRAVGVTEKIVAKIKDRLPAGTALLAFSADVYQPQLDEFQRIFQENGFLFTAAPASLVERTAIEDKADTKARDGYHWNEKGHELIAHRLQPLLSEILHSIK